MLPKHFLSFSSEKALYRTQGHFFLASCLKKVLCAESTALLEYLWQDASWHSFCSCERLQQLYQDKCTYLYTKCTHKWSKEQSSSLDLWRFILPRSIKHTVCVQPCSNPLRQEMDAAQTSKNTFYVLSVANWNNLPCFIYVEETSGMWFQSPCRRTVPSSRLDQFSTPQFLSFKDDH